MFDGIRPFCHPERRVFMNTRQMAGTDESKSPLVASRPRTHRTSQSQGKTDTSLETRLAALEANMNRPAASLPDVPRPRSVAVQCAMGREIYPFIQNHLSRSPFIVACVYHVTNRLILNDLATREGVCVLTMPLPGFSAQATQPQLNVPGASNGPDWSRIRPIGSSGPVRYIRYETKTSPGQVPLMHHKFMLGLSREKTPEWVITGSFNFTRPAAEIHDENVMFTDEPAVVLRFFAEFNRLYDGSQPPESLANAAHEQMAGC
jgi:hypothetical protein